MPIYKWYSETADKSVEILRPFSEYQDPPNSEEAIDGGLTVEEAADPKWQKRLGVNIKMVRGDSWRGSKGNW